METRIVSFLHASLLLVELTLVATDNPLDTILPGMEGIEFGGYQTHVELTFVRSTKNITAFYDELHDIRNGKTLIKSGGQLDYYFKDLNQSVSIAGTECNVSSGVKNMHSVEPQWLWKTNDYSLFGPSAVLWHYPVQSKFEGRFPVRGIICDKYTAYFNEDDVDVEYYFSASEWNPVSGMNLTVPVQVVVRYRNRFDLGTTAVQFDFTLWDPNLPSAKTFNIPVGIGCQGLDSPKNLQLSLPEEQFSFTMEFYKEFLRTKTLDVTIDVFKIWYDGPSQMIRVDGTYNKSGIATPFREVLDFVTGVTHLIYDDGKCYIKNINESSNMVNAKIIKRPKEILNLEGGDFYYIGKDVQRGIDCDIWESVRLNYKSSTGSIIDKAVLSYYYSSPTVEETSEGDEISQVPVTAMVTVYKANVSEPVAYTATNFFRFDQADLRPFNKFMSVEECYTAETARTYFLIDFPAMDKNVIMIAKANHHMLESTAVHTIAGAAGARAFRIPYLQVFYQEDRLQLFGLFVNRPPYIDGFIPDPRNPKRFYITENKHLSIFANAEECAQFCFKNDNFSCRSFRVCGETCSLSNQTTDFVNTNMISCSIYVRAVEPVKIGGLIIDDLHLEDAMKQLQERVDSGKLVMDIGKDKQFTISASKINYDVHPFNQDDRGILYEEVFNDHELRFQADTSVYKGIKVNALECYTACVDETSIACSSFSFCTNTKTCTLSAFYMKVGDDISLRHIDFSTSCDVYRKKDLGFFELTKGKLPRLKGYQDYENVRSDQQCSTFCKNDDTCKSFEFCANAQVCSLHKTHKLDVWDAIDGNAECRHYSLKYSADYKVLGGNMILLDPDSVTNYELSLEDCAKLCSEDLDSFGCSSFNYCPDANLVKSKCVLNKLNNIFTGNNTSIDNSCSHYWRQPAVIIPSKEDQIYQSLIDLIGRGYKAHVEVYDSAQNNSVFVEEYHDFRLRKGRLDLYRNTSRNSVYYGTEPKMIALFNERSCKVLTPSDSSTSDFFDKRYSRYWGWSSGNEIIGPSAIFFRKFAKGPEWKEQRTYRGILCEFFTGQDGLDPEVTVSFCFSAGGWNTATGRKLRVPIYAEAIGKEKNGRSVNLTIHLLYFEANLQNHYLFMIPRGIGCEGLEPGDTLPKIENQFSFVGEQFVTSDTSEKSEHTVKNLKIWYDGLGKVTKVTGITKQKRFSEIQDFNTGISFHFDDIGLCTIGPIDNFSFEKPDGNTFLNTMKSTNELLLLDAQFYYIGQDIQRNIYCNIWEAVKMNATWPERGIKKYHKIVYTYFFSTLKIQEVTNGDRNALVPITVQVSLYIIPDVIPVLWEFNFFDFDEIRQDRNFYHEMNIENCFLEESQQTFFGFSFLTTEEKAAIAKSNPRSLEVALFGAIQRTAKISPLRIPLLDIHYEANNILVEGKLIERAPILAGFQLSNGTNRNLVPNKGVKQLKVNNLNECAEHCASDSSIKCTGFTVCQDSTAVSNCYLTDKDGTMSMGETLPPTTMCKLYIKVLNTDGTTDVALSEAVKNLKSAVDAQKLTVDITSNSQTITFSASSFSTSSTPSGFFNSEHYEEVQTNKQLASGMETSLQVQGIVSTARECYQRCLNNPSIVCASFSFCTNTHQCRLSSVYIGPNNKDDVEDATSCRVYRKEAIRFFDKYPGQVIITLGDRNLDNINSAEDCAHLCRTEKNFTCKGFDYCQHLKKCSLSQSHILDSSLVNVNTSLCSHYSLKYSSEFVELGRDILVDPSSQTIEAMTAEECLKTCYDWDTFNCLSVNFCPEVNGKVSVCDLNTGTALDDNIVTKASDNCKHYYKKDTGQKIVNPESNEKGQVSQATYTGVLVSMFFVGLVLGVAGFLGYSYYKMRKSRIDAQSDITVSFTRQRD